MYFGIAAEPFGARTRLAEPAPREQHPDVPTALRRALIAAAPPGPVGQQLRRLLVTKTATPRRECRRRHVQQFGKDFQSPYSLSLAARSARKIGRASSWGRVCQSE